MPLHSRSTFLRLGSFVVRRSFLLTGPVRFLVFKVTVTSSLWPGFTVRSDRPLMLAPHPQRVLKVRSTSPSLRTVNVQDSDSPDHTGFASTVS